GLRVRSASLRLPRADGRFQAEDPVRKRAIPLRVVGRLQPFVRFPLAELPALFETAGVFVLFRQSPLLLPPCECSPPDRCARLAWTQERESRRYGFRGGLAFRPFGSAVQ